MSQMPPQVEASAVTATISCGLCVADFSNATANSALLCAVRLRSSFSFFSVCAQRVSVSLQIRVWSLQEWKCRICNRMAGAHSSAPPAVHKTSTKTVPSVIQPQGYLLAKDSKMTNQDKYSLVRRSDNYLQLKQTLGLVALPQKNLTRCRVKDDVLPKLPLDEKTADLFLLKPLTNEGKLWLERLNQFALDATEAKVPASLQDGLLVSSAKSATPCLEPLAHSETFAPLPPLPLVAMTAPTASDPAIKIPLQPDQAADQMSQAEPFADNSADTLNMPLLLLLSTALSPNNIHAFNARLEDMHTNMPKFLRPQTLEKAFVMLQAGVRQVCGGPQLSKVSGLSRLCASEACRALSDVAQSWHKLAKLDANKTETHRLMRAIHQNDPWTILQALYFLLLSERFWFLSLLDGGAGAITAELKRATAFVYLTLVLARILTRGGVLVGANMHQTQQPQEPTGNLTWMFEKHKTARSVISSLS